MVKHIVRFMQEEEGTTAVEYGLMLALITGVLVLAVTGLGGTLSNRFDAVGTIITGS